MKLRRCDFSEFVVTDRSTVIGASGFSGVNLHPWFTIIVVLKQVLVT